MPVEGYAGGPPTGPAQKGRDPVGPFPVAVLLGTEVGGGCIGPCVEVRPVIGGVHDDSVVGDAELVEFVQDHADVPVVLDHAVTVLILTADAAQFVLHVGAEVHARGIPPEEEGAALRRGLVKVVQRTGGHLVVYRLHALFRQRPGVLDPLAAVGHSPAVDDPARTVALPESGVLGVVLMLGLFLRVQVVEVPEELVETVVGGQVLVEVTQMVLAELGGGVAQGLQELGYGRVLRTQAKTGPRQADLGQARA